MGRIIFAASCFFGVIYYLNSCGRYSKLILLQTEPDFDLDIKEDVQEECSKFGRLKHIYIEK